MRSDSVAMTLESQVSSQHSTETLACTLTAALNTSPQLRRGTNLGVHRRGLGKEGVAYIHRALLFSTIRKKEVCRKVEVTGDSHMTGAKPISEKQVWNVFSCLGSPGFIEIHKITCVYKTRT